ncbi:DUF4919 domain-containing protein [Thalassotalea aquiviva]|uniref:DUF4919 domain-containing protein n=1 Tax=Thalassotalea aquiviva TaxID=3242415 RepID=UPI00352A2432
MLRIFSIITLMLLTGCASHDKLALLDKSKSGQINSQLPLADNRASPDSKGLISGNNDSAKPKSKHHQQNLKYNELLSKVKVLPTLEDIVKLKNLYIQTDYYQPFLGDEHDLSVNLFQQINNKQWRKCLVSAKQILAENFISINGHYGAMACYFETEQHHHSKQHRTILSMLLEAMWSSGNGRSPEQAIYSTSNVELYSFLSLTGLEVVKQSLIEIGEKSYDKIGVKDPDTDEEFDLYFDVTTQWQLGLKDIQ